MSHKHSGEVTSLKPPFRFRQYALTSIVPPPQSTTMMPSLFYAVVTPMDKIGKDFYTHDHRGGLDLCSDKNEDLLRLR